MYKDMHALSDPTENEYIIFKHSITCPISAAAKKEVDKFVEKHDELPVYVLIVQTHADLKLEIADHFGVKHESPQILVIKNGTVLGHRNHSDITAFTIEQAMNT